MSDNTTLVQMVVAIVATAAPIIVLVRVIAGGPDERLDATTAISSVPGLREEEPRPWRFAGTPG